MSCSQNHGCGFADRPHDAVFYSIYPLGMLGAPAANDFISSPVNRLAGIQDWIPHIRSLGCNALYLGPVFESDFHGYDTADYLKVDRRLGDKQALEELSRCLHQNNIRLILDGVFNHVGRNFFAFKDLQASGVNSVYRDWFCGVDFSRKSSYGDGFYYESWYDAYNLVKLNVQHPEVKNYLLKAVGSWMDDYGIDGLRLDVAEIIDKGFLADLAAFCRDRDPNFWLLGEVVSGDYRDWANDRMLDSATNYEAYKAIYSSHNDHNYYELAWTLNRQFGNEGIYRNLSLYNFVDNHDCSRIGSILDQPDHIFNVYVLLFTMPGIPSIYYGSEWGVPGIKGKHEDTALRPEMAVLPNLADCAIFNFIKNLCLIRKANIALQQGSYRELFVSHEQFVFERRSAAELVVILLNASSASVTLEFAIEISEGTVLEDLLDADYHVVYLAHLAIVEIPAYGARIFIAGKS